MKNKLFKILLVLLAIIILFISVSNLVIISTSNKYINKKIDYNDYKYILVLGAKVHDNYPSLMLKDRLDKALDIYRINNNIKIILSGDSVSKDIYDEVGTMYNYLINNNVDKSVIIKDNYGISTYDSIVRIKDLVEDNKIIIVTQNYHLPRSIYIANKYDIDSVGIGAVDIKYRGSLYRNIREIFARSKDYILTNFNFKPKYAN